MLFCPDHSVSPAQPFLPVLRHCLGRNSQVRRYVGHQQRWAGAPRSTGSRKTLQEYRPNCHVIWSDFRERYDTEFLVQYWIEQRLERWRGTEGISHGGGGGLANIRAELDGRMP
jgi:hypothetical protein